MEERKIVLSILFRRLQDPSIIINRMIDIKWAAWYLIEMMALLEFNSMGM